MKTLRRVLFIPTLVILALASLILFKIISPETTLPLEVIARIAALISLIVFILLSTWEGYETVQSWQVPHEEEPPTTTQVIYPKDPVDKVKIVVQTVDDVEAFSKRARNRIQVDIDTED